MGSKPAIRVIENPNALVIHGETPGQLVLLGAERGEWEITVTRDDGAQVAYHVSVAAIADGATPLDPGNRTDGSSDASIPRGYRRDLRPADLRRPFGPRPRSTRPASEVAPHQKTTDDIRSTCRYR